MHGEMLGGRTDPTIVHFFSKCAKQLELVVLQTDILLKLVLMSFRRSKCRTIFNLACTAWFNLGSSLPSYWSDPVCAYARDTAVFKPCRFF